jgi:hypothetical protein
MVRFVAAITFMLLVIAANNAFSQPQTIKVAVLENLKFEKLSTDKYANDYMDGLSTAADSAKISGYNVEIKTFFYDKEALAILKKVPDVKAWNPDLIIGPRSSSLFLMLKDQVSDVLVLSPFATATEVSTLPDNFYSVTLPNEYFTQTVVNLVRDHFKSKAVTPIGEVDCKNCVDFIKEFSNAAKTANVVVRPMKTFLNKNAETVSPSELLVNYKPGDVILVPNTSYTSGTLIARISDHLKDNKIAFVGGDGWGDWSSSYVGKVKSAYSYSAFRATPWSLDSTDEHTKSFLRDFKLHRHTDATGAASLLSYSTLIAAVNALKASNTSKPELPMRKRILESFKIARAKDKHYARPTKYAVYKVTQAGEKFDGEVSALK